MPRARFPASILFPLTRLRLDDGGQLRAASKGFRGRNASAGRQ